MRHRHLEIPTSTRVDDLGLEVLDDLLDRGDLGDWRPLLHDVARDPWGPISEQILHLVDSHPMQGTSALWRSWIEARRATKQPVHVGRALGALRRARGLTQREVAARLGMTQPEVSKLERRWDVRISTLSAYVGALGGLLVVSARLPDGDQPIV
jgi:DNA-binding transcriptional regulator YiaG